MSPLFGRTIVTLAGLPRGGDSSLPRGGVNYFTIYYSILYLRALRRCYTGAVGEVHPFEDCMRLQGDNTPAED